MSPESSLLIDEWVLPDVGAPLAGASEDMSYYQGHTTTVTLLQTYYYDYTTTIIDI